MDASPKAKEVSELERCLCDEIENYFTETAGYEVTGLYDMVMGEIESSLLMVVMKHTQSNQSLAAKVLGISRGTLRKKLQEYHLLKC